MYHLLYLYVLGPEKLCLVSYNSIVGIGASNPQ
jgi:hypothetical protein